MSQNMSLNLVFLAVFKETIFYTPYWLIYFMTHCIKAQFERFHFFLLWFPFVQCCWSHKMLQSIHIIFMISVYNIRIFQSSYDYDIHTSFLWEVFALIPINDILKIASLNCFAREYTFRLLRLKLRTNYARVKKTFVWSLNTVLLLRT